jgi:signal transduction histidine kinase
MPASSPATRSSSLTIHTVDPDGRIMNTLGGAASSASPPGTPIHEALAHLASRERIEAAIDDLKTGRLHSISWSLVERPGTDDGTRHVQLHISPIRESNHAIHSYVFCITDGSPSERLNRALIEAAVAINAATDELAIFREAARQASSILNAEEVVVAIMPDTGSSLQTVAHTGHSDIRIDELADRLRAFAGSSAMPSCVTARASDTNMEVMAPVRSDSAFGVRTPNAFLVATVPQSSLREFSGDVEHTLATIAWMTRAALEKDQRLRARASSELLASTGNVAARIAQELRSSLLGVASAVQLLRFRASEDPVMERNIGRMMRDIDRLNRMSASLMELGGSEHLELVPADPDDVWDAVIEEHRGRMESRSIVLNRTRANGTARCALDAERLARAFSHVLLNAIENAPEASDLTLVSEQADDGSWTCQLTNAGAPVSEETLQRAFEVLFSTRADGTGIGLALSRRIMDEHNGTIGLESVDTGGVTATFSLPCAE